MSGQADTRKKIFSHSNQAGDPFNVARKLFHLVGLLIPAIFFFNLLDYVFPVIFKDNTRSWAFFLLAGVTIFLLVIEFLRFRYPFWQDLFLKVAGPLLKGKEIQKMHGSVPYMLGMAIVLAFMPREIAMITGLYLAFGDPAAAYFGGRYGTIRFYNGKSLQGTLGGIAGAFLSSVVFMLLVTLWLNPGSHLALWNDQGVLWSSWLILAVGAVAALAFEFVSHEGFLDDNLTIPVGSGAVMTLLLSLFRQEPLMSYFYSFWDLFVIVSA